MKKEILIAFIFYSCFDSVAFGQEEPGYIMGCVITINRDTLYGEVKNVNYFPYVVLENIKFKMEGSNKVVNYKPDELIAYLSGVELYYSKKIEKDKKIFVKKVLSGYLSLYSEFVITKETATTIYYLQKTNEEYLTRVNANFLDGSFKEQMLAYLKDAPTICNDIEKKVFKRKDIEQIVYLYNLEKGK